MPHTISNRFHSRFVAETCICIELPHNICVLAISIHSLAFVHLLDDLLRDLLKSGKVFPQSEEHLGIGGIAAKFHSRHPSGGIALPDAAQDRKSVV